MFGTKGWLVALVSSETKMAAGESMILPEGSLDASFVLMTRRGLACRPRRLRGAADERERTVRGLVVPRALR